MAGFSQAFIDQKIKLLKEEIQLVKRGKYKGLSDEKEQQKYLKQLEQELKEFESKR